MHRKVGIQNLINYLRAIIEEGDKIEKKYPDIEYTFYFSFSIYNYKQMYYKNTGFLKLDNERIGLEGVILDKKEDFIAYDILRNSFIILSGEDIYKAEFIRDDSFDSFINTIEEKQKLVLTDDYVGTKLNFILDKERYILIDNLIEKSSQISNQIRTQNKDNKKQFVILNVVDTFTYLYNDPYYYYPIMKIEFVFNIKKYLNSPSYSSLIIHNLIKDFKNIIINLSVKHNIINNSLIFNTELVEDSYYKNISIFVSFDFYNFLDILLLSELCEK